MRNVRKKLLSGLGAAALLLSALAFLLFPSVTSQAAAKGLAICGSAILPSLFPFFVITNLWIALGYADMLSRLAAPVMQPVFRLPGAAASALIMGCTGGYPVGAQVTAKLYQAKAIHGETARHMLFFCCNAGPAFIVGMAGAGIFQSVQIGIALYLIHVLGALLLGFLFRPKRCEFQPPCGAEKVKAPSFSAALTDAIGKAGATTVQICIFVLFFSILAAFITYFTPASLRASPWFSLLLGSLELAGGANLLASAACPAVWKLCAAAFLLGWGGFCVHGQTLSILQEAGLPVSSYLLGKLLHGLLSAALAYLAAPLLSLPVACSAVQTPSWRYPLVQLLLLTLLVVWAAYFLKITTGKAMRNRL